MKRISLSHQEAEFKLFIIWMSGLNLSSIRGVASRVDKNHEQVLQASPFSKASNWKRNQESQTQTVWHIKYSEKQGVHFAYPCEFSYFA